MRAQRAGVDVLKDGGVVGEQALVDRKAAPAFFGWLVGWWFGFWGVGCLESVEGARARACARCQSQPPATDSSTSTPQRTNTNKPTAAQAAVLVAVAVARHEDDLPRVAALLLRVARFLSFCLLLLYCVSCWVCIEVWRGAPVREETHNNSTATAHRKPPAWRASSQRSDTARLTLLVPKKAPKPRGSCSQKPPDTCDGVISCRFF